MVPHRMDNLGWLPLEPTSRIIWPAGRWMHGHIISLVAVPAHMGRAISQHVRPPPPAQQRPTLSPSGRVVPRSGTSMIQLTTAAAEQARLKRRCQAAARVWGVSPEEPCIQGLPSSVRASLESGGLTGSKPPLSIPTPLGPPHFATSTACPGDWSQGLELCVRCGIFASVHCSGSCRARDRHLHCMTHQDLAFAWGSLPKCSILSSRPMVLSFLSDSCRRGRICLPN